MIFLYSIHLIYSFHFNACLKSVKYSFSTLDVYFYNMLYKSTFTYVGLMFQKAIAPDEYLQLVAMDHGLQAGTSQSRPYLADFVHRKVSILWLV